VLTERRHSVPSRPLLDQRQGEAMAYPISDKCATFMLGDRSFDTPYNPGDLERIPVKLQGIRRVGSSWRIRWG
jgi:hypothetical protein